MINGRIVDSYSNIQTIKLNTADDDERYLRDGFERYLGAILPFMRSLTGVRVSLTALSGLMIVTVAAIAIDLWTRNAITVGQVSFTLGLVLRLNMLLGRLMMQLNGMLRQLGLIENSMRLVSAPLGLEDRPGAKPLQVTKARIDVQDVTFHYGKAAGVLDNINLTVRGGERVGLVGHSGAGKSTLVNLILRLYDVEKGAILVEVRTFAMSPRPRCVGRSRSSVRKLHCSTGRCATTSCWRATMRPTKNCCRQHVRPKPMGSLPVWRISGAAVVRCLCGRARRQAFWRAAPAHCYRSRYFEGRANPHPR